MEIQREGFALRKLKREDLLLILSWRNDPLIRSVSQSDHMISQEEHEAWFERNDSSTTSKLLIFENSGQSYGSVNFTGIDDREARWGFYLDPRQFQKGLGLKMGFLALDLAFRKYHWTRIRAEVLGSNERGLRYHQSLGFQIERNLKNQIQRENQKIDLFHLFHSAELWEKMRHSLEVRIWGPGSS